MSTPTQPDPRVTTTADDLGVGTPDPRVTTTADDLAGGLDPHDLDEPDPRVTTTAGDVPGEPDPGAPGFLPGEMDFPEREVLPSPSTPEGWKALQDEAAGHGYPNVDAYVRAYADGRLNVGAAGYQPGNPHTGFGQIQALDHEAGAGGHPIAEYADDIRQYPEGAGFHPPANFTSNGDPVEYDADGTPHFPVYVVAPTMPEGVDHYDPYTGEPLDAAGHVVPGVADAGEGHTFTSALDQRIGLDEHGRVDPDEVDRLEHEAREAGYGSVDDHLDATTRPFPGHPGSPDGTYAHPTVGEGQPPRVYSGPDGSYVITSTGTVITASPGGEIVYEDAEGSVVVDPDGTVTSTWPEHDRGPDVIEWHTDMTGSADSADPGGFDGHDIDPGQIDPDPHPLGGEPGNTGIAGGIDLDGFREDAGGVDGNVLVTTGIPDEQFDDVGRDTLDGLSPSADGGDAVPDNVREDADGHDLDGTAPGGEPGGVVTSTHEPGGPDGGASDTGGFGSGHGDVRTNEYTYRDGEGPDLGDDDPGGSVDSASPRHTGGSEGSGWSGREEPEVDAVTDHSDPHTESPDHGSSGDHGSSSDGGDAGGSPEPDHAG